MSEPPGYRLLEHTADAGLVAWGPQPADAFAEATRGMFALILGAEPGELAQEMSEAESLHVRSTGEEWDDLLVNWLADVLFLFDTEGLVPIEVHFTSCSPPTCEATILCRRLTDATQAGGVGVKAITYHQLYVNVSPSRTELQVIFDI